MTDHDLPTRTEGEGETLDMPEGLGTFSSGQVLGERYQILEMLGRGGMGEVWKAFDLKLRVEVALKALRPEFFKSERRLDMLRQEVRAAREVMSPNVCRIFDLVEVEGRELVSMEYVDGATLLGVLQERGPLDLKEAQDIASQFLAGLEAIHKVGLVHRDIKPENIMLTRASRVVVMDFGLARQEEEGGGSVAGTPAYMSPEQAAGQTLDPRADVYSAGVVLAEMVSPDGISDLQSRQSVWEGVRSEPAQIPDTPWAKVIEKAVARDREHRFNTAHTLTRALEDVTLRVEGADDLHPYPGLASFTESDAEYFFGREAEIEQMWRKLEGPPRMLALAGPSGAGKSSFLRAGLVAAKTTAWATVVCTPGSSPMRALANAFVEEFAGDADAMRQMLDFEVADSAVEMVSRWSNRHDHALLIVDQFEELFTQNSQDVQDRFGSLLVRMVLEADVHVLLSMREDFLFRCHAIASLESVFHEITPIGPPVGGALRRALTQPAMKCGYRFEDDDLVEEMLTEVEGERGALPLLAFAAARLWEMRDRETGLLTRQAYQDIGGVGGALARHAEATIDRIGGEHIGIVRELFRNLVTAEGTRAVREWDELLSIFSDPQGGSQPEEVLRALIDARLLTSYEIREEDEAPTRRVEIIHESLLANWPRLVRWQTQDADAVQLRDQLRQAANTWEEHERAEDLLWTGSTYREFTVWHERYPGGLTEIEQAFAAAMTSLANRRKRRRRIAATAAIVLALVIAAVFGTLWRRSVLETRRAEASKLLALAQVQLEKDPTEALAYATSSLELADTREARVFALRALWAAPPARLLPGENNLAKLPVFSPDGRWLAAAGHREEVLVWPETGSDPIRLPGHTVSPRGGNAAWWISSGFLVTGHWLDQRVRVWSMPEGRLVRTIDVGGDVRWQAGETHLFAKVIETGNNSKHTIAHLRSWEMPDGEVTKLGSVDLTALGATNSVFDRTGRSWIYARGNSIYYRPLPILSGTKDLVLGRHDNDAVALVPRVGERDRVWSRDRTTHEMKCWSLTNPGAEPLAVIPPPPGDGRYLVRIRSGLWRVSARDGGAGNAPELWYLDAPAGARTLKLGRNDSWFGSEYMAIHPDGTWMATPGGNWWNKLVIWPLVKNYPAVIDVEQGFTGGYKPFAFGPDGKWIAAPWGKSSLRLWRVRPTMYPDVKMLQAPFELGGVLGSITFDTTGEQVVITGLGTQVAVMPLDGTEARVLEGFSDNHLIFAAAFSPSGRLVAAGSSWGAQEPKVLRVWDLDTGEVRAFELDAPESEQEDPLAPESGVEHGIHTLQFVDESTLYSGGYDGVRRWNLETGTSEVIVPGEPGMGAGMFMSADRGTMLTLTYSADSDNTQAAVIHDLNTGASRGIRLALAPDWSNLAIGPTGRVVVQGCMDGSVRVGRIDRSEVNLLLGHDGPVVRVAVSPDGAWIASAGEDETLRLWPMPDLSKPPLHTLPREELIAKLKTLTNLRVVRDPESGTGWTLTHDPFPGWETVPVW